MRSVLALSISCLISLSCVQHDLVPQPFDCLNSDLKIHLLETVPATSCENIDGKITADATGGLPPYVFTLNNEAQSIGTFDDLSPGIHALSVTDARGCAATLENISINSNSLSFQTDIIEDTDCANGNGSVMILVNEGEPPFEFLLEGVNINHDGVFTSLRYGTYQINFRDANSCTLTLTITIPKGNTQTSWTRDVKPIIEKSCALSGCHNGKARQDLRIYEKAKFYSSQIKSLTQDGSMPYEGRISQEEIDLLACWVDEGAKNN